MPTYLIRFPQHHEEFRLPELESLARIENIELKYDKAHHQLDNPYLKVDLESHDAAKRLVRRAILVKNVYELWAEGNDYDELHAMLKRRPNNLEECGGNKSFKFIVTGYGFSCTAAQKVDIVNSFAYLPFDGQIDMANPDLNLGVLEDYGSQTNRKGRPSLKHVYMGKMVASVGGDTVVKYDLKKRVYLGTTSMDARLSLVMANQALAAPGKLVYDPFVGTGSFLCTCSHFGAYTLGSDIDGRQIRGKDKAGVKSNIDQYNLQGRVLDSLIFDVCHNPWRKQAWLDAIVTAPYGVRAGAKTLGRKDGSKKTEVEQPFQKSDENGEPVYQSYPPTKPYEMSEVLADLLIFAAEQLVVGGRLVYWLPTVVDEYTITDVPEHPCMTLISNSEQNFGFWSRRLITMEKTKQLDPTEHGISIAKDGESDSLKQQEFGHFLFREKYFQPSQRAESPQ